MTERRIGKTIGGVPPGLLGQPLSQADQGLRDIINRSTKQLSEDVMNDTLGEIIRALKSEFADMRGADIAAELERARARSPS